MFNPLTGRKEEPYKVSEWRDRVLDLCEYDFTHTFFGLGYNDLMRLDTAEFEEIEERVHKMAKRQSESMGKIKDGTNKDQSNLLKDVKR